MKQNIELVVYLIGIVLFGIFYGQLKAALDGGIWFFLAAIAIIIAIRCVGIVTRRMIQRRQEQHL